MVYLSQTVGYPNSSHLIATRAGAKPATSRSQVQRTITAKLQSTKLSQTANEQRTSDLHFGSTLLHVDEIVLVVPDGLDAEILRRTVAVN